MIFIIFYLQYHNGGVSISLSLFTILKILNLEVNSWLPQAGSDFTHGVLSGLVSGHPGDGSAREYCYITGVMWLRMCVTCSKTWGNGAGPSWTLDTCTPRAVYFIVIVGSRGLTINFISHVKGKQWQSLH